MMSTGLACHSVPGGSEDSPGLRTAALERAPSDCVVARAPGVTLTKRDLYRWQAHANPAPPLPELSRIAVDALAAQWIIRRRVEAEPPAASADFLRRAMNRVRDEPAYRDGLAPAFAHARAEARIRLGPCYIPLPTG